VLKIISFTEQLNVIPSGIWIFVYRGEAGAGVGLMEIANGELRGCDWGHIKYSGTVTEIVETNELLFDVTMDVPAGVTHSSGAGPMDIAHRRQRTVRLPRDFDSGEPQTFGMTPGPITVMFYPVDPGQHAWARLFLSGFSIVPDKPPQATAA
jgi:hypothetical protein